MTSPRTSPVDQSGRVLGPRAQDTRRRLLDATAELLEQQSLRELRVVEIARKVGTSPATFYQYFRDVEDSVLQLAEEATEEIPAMVEQIVRPWLGPNGLDEARAVVDRFICHWDDHRAVLRVRNLASEEGNRRFQGVRAKAMTPVLEALSAKIAESQAAGRVPEGDHPHAAAAALAAILERLAAYHRELEHYGVTRADLVETSARILYRTAVGPV